MANKNGHGGLDGLKGIDSLPLWVWIFILLTLILG